MFNWGIYFNMQEFLLRFFTKSAQILGKIYVLYFLPYSYFGEVGGKVERVGILYFGHETGFFWKTLVRPIRCRETLCVSVATYQGPPYLARYCAENGGACRLYREVHHRCLLAKSLQSPTDAVCRLIRYPELTMPDVIQGRARGRNQVKLRNGQREHLRQWTAEKITGEKGSIVSFQRQLSRLEQRIHMAHHIIRGVMGKPLTGKSGREEWEMRPEKKIGSRL